MAKHQLSWGKWGRGNLYKQCLQTLALPPMVMKSMFALYTPTCLKEYHLSLHLTSTVILLPPAKGRRCTGITNLQWFFYLNSWPHSNIALIVITLLSNLIYNIRFTQFKKKIIKNNDKNYNKIKNNDYISALQKVFSVIHIKSKWLNLNKR